jgi:hypothetical protein
MTVVNGLNPEQGQDEDEGQSVRGITDTYQNQVEEWLQIRER